MQGRLNQLYESFDDRTALADTGSSFTVDNTLDGLREVHPIHEIIGGIGDGAIYAQFKGVKDYIFEQVDGTRTLVRNVRTKVALDSKDILFALQLEQEEPRCSKILTEDNSRNLTLTYPDGQRVVFDRCIKT